VSLTVSAKTENADVRSVTLLTTPDKCAVCGRQGQPDFIVATIKRQAVSAVFRCPIADCRSLYIAIYRCSGIGPHAWDAVLHGRALARYSEKKEFPDNVAKISPSFCDIFNQASIAEENGLNHICGPGYRKALEFLIRDYLIQHKLKGDEKVQEQVKKTFLGPVIENYIDDERIKRCAKRATWLGNDETHYVRKWEDKDLSDLKALILLTVDFIDSSIEAERYFSDMSEPK
jgi:hypothetical protein